MRLVIYEWCCSGGLAGPDRKLVVHPGDDVNSLAREGQAMFRALVADAVRDGGFDVAAIVDESLPLDLPAAARRVVVPRGRAVETLVAVARDVDSVILVAPETAGVLVARVESVRAVGGTDRSSCHGVRPGRAGVHRRRTRRGLERRTRAGDRAARGGVDPHATLTAAARFLGAPVSVWW